jgi:hypothetical protein
MIDREALTEAVNGLVDMLNADAPDHALRPSARRLAPLVTQIVTDADAETAEEVKAMLAEIFKPEAPSDE